MRLKALDIETGEIKYFNVRTCSICNKWVIDDPSYKFCPYCGARKEKEDVHQKMTDLEIGDVLRHKYSGIRYKICEFIPSAPSTVKLENLKFFGLFDYVDSNALADYIKEGKK